MSKICRLVKSIVTDTVSLRSMWEVGAKERPQLTGVVDLHAPQSIYSVSFSHCLSLWSSRQTQTAVGAQSGSLHIGWREHLFSLSLPFSSICLLSAQFFSCWTVWEVMESETSPESEGQSGKCLRRKDGKDALGLCLSIGGLEMDFWLSVFKML